MNYNTFLVYDLETTSVNKNKCQITQIGGLPVHSRKLEIINDPFVSYVKPIFDEEECIKYNLDPVTEEVLELTKIKRSDLESAPPIKVVWDQFCDYVNQYNYKKTKWTASVPVTYNGENYDKHIIDRVAIGHNIIVQDDLKANIKNLISTIKTDEKVEQTKQVKELFKLSVKLFKNNSVWGFGPSLNGECSLFHPIHSIDVMKLLFNWTENLQEIRSLSLSSVCDWLGISSENSHQADVDTLHTAQILIRFLKYIRKHSTTTKFKNSFKEQKG